MSKEMSEIKPASFKNGVPKADRNGFFGAEADFIASAGERIVAIVTYEVVRVMHEELEDEKYPVIEIKHIEPLRDEKSIAVALQLRDAAYKVRTGENALELPEVEG